MIKKPILISGAVLLGLVSIVGWSFELPKVEETIGAFDLLFRSSVVGVLIGAVIGFALAVQEKRLISKFQAFATALLLSTLLVCLLGHFTNRFLADDEIIAEQMPVKQVTATWNGKGVSRLNLESPPVGYFVFVETDQGTIRLFKPGRIQPDIGPSRTLLVEKQIGFWGYPRYSISTGED